MYPNHTERRESEPPFSPLASGGAAVFAYDDSQEPDCYHQVQDVQEKGGVASESTFSTTKSNREADDSLFTLKSEGTVRLAMTLLFVLMVPAALLSLWAAPQYHLIIITFWIILWTMFAGLIWVVSVVASQRHVLHPVLHKVGEAIVTEYRDFLTDYKYEMLMLTNEADANEETLKMAQPPTKRKHKSRVFIVFVKPFLPMIARRQKRKERRRQQEEEPQVVELV